MTIIIVLSQVVLHSRVIILCKQKRQLTMFIPGLYNSDIVFLKLTEQTNHITFW